MKGNLLPFLLTLLAVLGVLFFRSLDPRQVLFSNDAPLGALTAAANNLVDSLFGSWGDQNWVGFQLNGFKKVRRAGAPLA